MEADHLLRRMHAHKRWANRRLFDAVAALPERDRRRAFSIGRGSAWATIVHLWGVDEAWIRTLAGEEDATIPGEGAVADPAALAAAWAETDGRWDALLAGLPGEDLDRMVFRSSTSTGGRRRGMPLADVLVHVCTHAQSTGAQLLNILRRLRVEPLPAISLTTLSRAEHAG